MALEVRRDGGWAWLVLVAAFFNLFISGLPFCIGVYVNELVIEQDMSHATGGLFGGLQIAMVYLGGPATLLSERFTYRAVIFSAGLLATAAIVASIHITNIHILFFTFATLPGLCIGVAYIQSIIVLNRYFDRYAGLANGVALAGCGMGTIVIPFLYDYIIHTYSWRQSLYIVAGCTLHACVFAMILRPISMAAIDDDNTQSQENMLTKTARRKLFRDPRFYLFMASNTLWSASMSVVFVLGANLFYERGMTNSQSSILLALVGSGNLGVRIAIGFLLHIRKWNLIAVHSTISAVMALSIAMFVMHDSFASFAAACFLFGLTYGATTVTQALVPRVIAGVQNYGTAYSAAVGFCVIGITGGPPLNGYIHDKTKSYEAAFLVSSSFALVSALLLSASFCLQKCGKNPVTVETLDVSPPTTDVTADVSSPTTDVATESSPSSQSDDEHLLISA